MIATPPRTSYMICCLPRSGSWLLADALKMTGVAGIPEEYYWHEFYDDYCCHWGLPTSTDFASFFRYSMLAGTTPNGMFGAKLHWDELCDLDESLRILAGAPDLDTVELLYRFFPQPKFIYLHRADKVRQAISWFRAGSTARWYDVAGESRRSVDPEPDWPRILLLERILRSEEQRWRDFFKLSRIEPVHVAYEELLSNFEVVIDRVLSAIGARPPDGFKHPAPRLKKQRDETTEEWVQQYLVVRRTLWPTDDELYGPLR
jgi:trehalose 2-sulfotransferase